MRLPIAAVAWIALLSGGCGYIGAPLPPLVNIPARATDLSVVQQGSRFLIGLTIPDHTTENVAIRGPLRLELRIGPAGSDWESHAEAVETPVEKPGPVSTETPTGKWAGQEVTIGARTVGANGKASAWSNFITLRVVPPPATPSGVAAEATASGVRLHWAGPGGTFRIFRRAGEEKSFSAVATAKETEWTDRESEFGKPYTYRIQRLVDVGDHHEALSEPSAEVSITPVDTFPPAAPTGVQALAAPASVELSWERNSETDLAGYRIYRAAPGGDFERIAEVSQLPAYSDTKVEHGKTYRYAVTAFDRAGNESVRSAVVEATP